ncbi:MAG: hypothetical protein AAGD33_15445 [Actinomycetota bacterium]
MLDSDRLERAATAIADAHRTLVPIGGVDALGDDVPTTIDEGYAVQARVRELAGIDPVAWKVGATSEVAQQFLGVDAPFLGRPGRDRIVGSGSTIELTEWCCGFQAIEVEVGLRPTVDLDAGRLGDVGVERLALASLVDVVPCIEVVDFRFGVMVGLPAPCLIADNGVNCALVVGEPLDLSTDDVIALDALAVRLDVSGGGEPIAPVEATAAAALGHPLIALRTAAEIAISLGTPIRAGEVVSTGTCTGLQAVAAGMAVTANVGEGHVALDFL